MQEKLFGEFRTATIIVIIIVATILIAILFNWVAKRYIKKTLMAHGRDLISFQYFRQLLSLEATAPLKTSAKAKGTVNLSDMPITISVMK